MKKRYLAAALTLFILITLFSTLLVILAGEEGIEKVVNETSVETNNTELADELRSAQQMVKNIYIYVATMLLLTLIVAISILVVEAMIIH